jgi:hypothetical protein
MELGMTIDRQFLRDLCSRATPGPWRIYGRHERSDGSPYGIDFIENEQGDQIVCGDSGVYPPDGPDAEFISASRTAIPELLDALDAADAERAHLNECLVKSSGVQHELIAKLANWQRTVDSFRSDIAKLEAELAALRTTTTTSGEP